jgi:hypothetical protein
MSDLFSHREHAPILRIFGHHASRMSALLRNKPQLLQRIVYAPRPAIHAIGAFLHLNPMASQPDAIVATMLEETAPRQLLRSTIPNAPPRLYRALHRAGDAVCERSFYERIAALCDSPLIEHLVADGPLTNERLDWAEMLLRCDPAILRIPGMLTLATHQVQNTDTMIKFLRAYGVFEEDDLMTPIGAGQPAMVRKLQLALDRIVAPVPPFSLPPPFRHVQTLGELRALGEQLKNCVRSPHSCGTEHWFKMASGSGVYITTDAFPMLAALQKVGPDLWHLEQVAATRNAPLEPVDYASFMNALRAAGICLVRELPHHALQFLHMSPHDNWEDAIDETEEIPFAELVAE